MKTRHSAQAFSISQASFELDAPEESTKFKALAFAVHIEFPKLLLLVPTSRKPTRRGP